MTAALRNPDALRNIRPSQALPTKETRRSPTFETSMHQHTLDERQGSRSLSTPLIAAIIAIVVVAAALILKRLMDFDFGAALVSLIRIPLNQIAAILTFAAASYICLTGFDWLALRYIGRPLPYRRVALASFTSLSLGHNIGFAAMSSGAIRYYTRWGLSAGEVAKIIVFCGVTVGLGLVTLGGIAAIAMPELSGRVTGLAPTSARMVGVACLSLSISYLLLAGFRQRPIRIRKWSFEIPDLRIATGQIALGTLNFAMVAACLHQSLNAFSAVDYAAVATVYVLANGAAIASHIPGGLGVIEGAVLFLLPDQSSLTAVLLFRLAYFIVPLAFGVAALLLSEFIFRNQGARPNADK
jgi:glycosyltransferase 2 family protein